MTNTVRTKFLYCIVGKAEILKELENTNTDNIVVISICDIDREHPEFKENFRVLKIKFWDITTQIGGYKPITIEQAKEIAKFIQNNKSKQFALHCEAGQSRSAGVGEAIECILGFNGDVYSYMTSNRAIKNNPRYSPNKTVFNKIVEEWEN